MNGFSINGDIPVTFFSNMLIFRDSNKYFELDGDLLETMTIYDFNFSQCNPQDQKLIYKFGREMNFVIRQKGRKSGREKSALKLLKSPAIMASVYSTMFLPSDPNISCERWKLLLQKKQAGNNSDKIIEEKTVIVDKLLEYKCIFKKHYRQTLIKCNLIHTKKK